MCDDYGARGNWSADRRRAPDAQRARRRHETRLRAKAVGHDLCTRVAHDQLRIALRNGLGLDRLALANVAQRLKAVLQPAAAGLVGFATRMLRPKAGVGPKVVLDTHGRTAARAVRFGRRAPRERSRSQQRPSRGPGPAGRLRFFTCVGENCMQ